MNYLFENLGDERFQEFCGILVSREFPNAQLFPIGQPDGGRDAVVYLMDGKKKEFLVFQVKFVRKPYQERDLHKWLLKIIEDELPKVNSLVSKGATRYYLITNISGTAHPEVGSIDKMNELLESKMSIPSMCWWRDDIIARFEKDPIFKWSFPEILSGQDVLNSVLFNNINENRERRENVIRAYLADQHKMDNEVKFRQIDLQNKLFSLFTDVPIRIKKYNIKNRKLKAAIESFHNRIHRPLAEDQYYSQENSKKMGAAEFLLHPKVQQEISQILLEGGPGQGKSTISQYVSQVHRVRLLQRAADTTLLPNSILNSPIRLPFKLDLRHIASWVENVNPYVGTVSEEYFNKKWHKSLESFLIAHIFYHSKIDEFSTSDLIAIFKLSPVLLVFDGFDEIANITVREEVIDFINKGINRLSENSKSIQVIITSRPAAFSESVGFSIDKYPHFELSEITHSIIEEYVEKWIEASGLNSKEGSEIRGLVKEKIRLPHLRELAKSPMQLAIFISLLRTRGESLPNKRTALYDSYIELFFNRESEKNHTIRDHRDLIVQIHEYLGWVLHSESELHKNSGIIQIGNLKEKINLFLEKEGHKTDITEKLFQVVEERVCALVSRVQGTFEFEVQPLREYFCARYLYNTKPYSPAGKEKRGTLPDRFDAISRSSYWQNVVRFFAGCFDRGELSMLIQKLNELVEDRIFKYTNYPRLLTSQLLSDFVFAQFPKQLRDVVKIIVDGINLGNIINQTHFSTDNSHIILPIECGRIEVATECLRQLKAFPPIDYATELIGLLKNNPHQVLENWIDFSDKIDGENLSLWLDYAYHLELIHKIPASILDKILKADNYKHAQPRLQAVVNAGKFDFITESNEYSKILLHGILEGALFIHPAKRYEGIWGIISICFNFHVLERLIGSENQKISILDFTARMYGPIFLQVNVEDILSQFNSKNETESSILEFLKSGRKFFDAEVLEWRTSVEPWEILVGHASKAFGDQWIFYIIATISSGIKSKTQIFDDHGDIANSSLSLCKRARYARLKSGNVNYWQEQFKIAEEMPFKLLLFFTWATPNLIVQLLKTINTIINNLSSDSFAKILRGLGKTTRNSQFTKMQSSQLIDGIDDSSQNSRVRYLLSRRFDSNQIGEFICGNLSNDLSQFKDAFEIRLEYLIVKFIENPIDEKALEEIHDIYNNSKKFFKRSFLYYRHRYAENPRMPIDTAKKIMEKCNEYPKVVSTIAEKACHIYANEKTIPVGEIAKKDRWFDE